MDLQQRILGHLSKYSVDRYDSVHWNKMYVRKPESFYHVYSVQGGYMLWTTPCSKRKSMRNEIFDTFGELIVRMNEIAPLDQWSFVGKGNEKFRPEWSYRPVGYAVCTHRVGTPLEQSEVDYIDSDPAAAERYRQIMLAWIGEYTAAALHENRWMDNGVEYEMIILPAKVQDIYLVIQVEDGRWVRPKVLKA